MNQLFPVLVIAMAFFIGPFLIIGGLLIWHKKPIGKTFVLVGIIINIILIAYVFLQSVLPTIANIPFHTDIESDTLLNSNYRKVLFTGNLQLVLMSLHPGEEVGSEVHQDHDQFFRIEQGQATAVLNGIDTKLVQNDVLIVPAGTTHNIINDGNIDLKFYTIYAPAEEPANTLQVTKP